MSKLESLECVHPTQTLALDSSLFLIPRLKLILTVHRGDASIKPLDEWQLRRSLLDFFAVNFSLTIPDDDLRVRRFKDLNKRKRHYPVATGALVVKDLGFLSKCDGGDVGKRYGEWRKSVVEKMDGMEVSIVGVKFRLGVELPGCDDFEGMVKQWEELIAFGGYSKGGRRQPDTIVLRGVPSRWFAEPRVSSKPSMLVTHTIFSAFGKIRNLDVAEDDDIEKLEEEDAGDIVPGLHCKIVVRFEEYRDFYNALKVLSGRSLQKEGSRLRADYEVNWDKEGFLRDSRTHPEKSSRRALEERYKSEAPRRHSYNSHFSNENTRSKRFKE